MSRTGHDVPTRSQIKDWIATRCKPPGSLGAIESIALQLCMTQGTLQPETRPRSVTVFAADHGVTSEGVSAWPSLVTQSVVELMQGCRTASGAFAKTLGCEYEIVDVGLLDPLAKYEAVALDRAKRRGSGNLRTEPALSDEDFQHVWNVGKERASVAVNAGSRVLIGGEMGIGNTTPATCLIALLCDVQDDETVSSIVGPGAGADEAQLSQKRTVILDSVRRVRARPTPDPRQIGCHVGGLEIVALAGYYATGASLGATLLIDGVIATSAALLAEAIRPGTHRQMIAGHRSTETAQQIALKHLGLEPIQDLQMRLGEATGALAALPLVDLAASMMIDMASIDDLRS